MRDCDTTIKAGDIVKSYDFDHTDDSYVIGTVTGIEWHEGCDRYVIQVQAKVRRGEFREVHPEARTVYPPVNGTAQTFADWPTNFVHRI